MEGLKPVEEFEDDDCMTGGNEMNDGADLVLGLLELLVDDVEVEAVIVFGDVMLAPVFWIEVSIRAGWKEKERHSGNGMR